MLARRGRSDGGEPAATFARRDDVGADVAEGGQPTLRAEPGEPSDRPPGRVFQVDALDRILAAEVEDLVDGGPTDARCPEHPL